MLTTLVSLGLALASGVQDRPAVTFAFFGCNRVDAADVTTANPSTANVPQLLQNLRDIAQLKPNYIFAGGDIVMNYADDMGETLRAQTEAWYSLVKTVKLPGTELIVLPGNHETNRKVGDDKLVNPWTEKVWVNFIDSHGLRPKGSETPYGGDQNPDEVSEMGAKTNYSFDRGPVHFVILNTDTKTSVPDAETGKLPIGMVPLAWLKQDLDSAEANPNLKAIIVMGHRNLIDPSDIKGDAPINPLCAAPMEKALKSHGKVRAYVCAHVHSLDIRPFPGASRPVQTIFGNGGSKLEKGWKPVEGRTFGFGFFQVFKDGSVTVTPYVRPEPADYQSADVGPAVARPMLKL